MKLVIVGEAPVAGARLPEQFLHPAFCASGRRLLLYSGWTYQEFLKRTDRRNLMPLPAQEQRWDARVARDCAGIEARTIPFGASVVLLGQRVAEAFEFEGPLMRWRRRSTGLLAERLVAVVPHPSGRNRWYNDLTNVAWARQFLRETMDQVIDDARTDMR